MSPKKRLNPSRNSIVARIHWPASCIVCLFVCSRWENGSRRSRSGGRGRERVKESRHRKENQRPPDLPVLFTSLLSLSRFRFSLFSLRFSSFLFLFFCRLIFKHRISHFPPLIVAWFSAINHSYQPTFWGYTGSCFFNVSLSFTAGKYQQRFFTGCNRTDQDSEWRLKDA